MPIPSVEEVQSNFLASWRLMQGKADAVRQLDLSADGFWNSFFAFVVAIPPLFILWTSEAIEVAPANFGARLGVVLRLAVIEAVAWVGPILLVAYVLHQMGRRDRIAAFVVANNWGTALVSWIVLPIIMMITLVPSLEQVGVLLLLIAFVAVLVLFWRLNDSVLGMGPIVATGSVIAMVGLSFLADYMLRSLLALPYVPSSG